MKLKDLNIVAQVKLQRACHDLDVQLIDVKPGTSDPMAVVVLWLCERVSKLEDRMNYGGEE